MGTDCFPGILGFYSYIMYTPKKLTWNQQIPHLKRRNINPNHQLLSSFYIHPTKKKHNIFFLRQPSQVIRGFHLATKGHFGQGNLFIRLPKAHGRLAGDSHGWVPVDDVLEKLWEGERSDNDYRDMMILFFDPIIKIMLKKNSIRTLRSCFFGIGWKKYVKQTMQTKIALSLIAKQSFFARVLGWLHTRNWWHMMAHDHHSPADSNLKTPPKGVTMLHQQNTCFPFFQTFPNLFRDLYIFQIKHC